MLRAAIEAMEAAASAKPLAPESIAQIEQMKDVLVNGASVRVNTTTGQIVEFGSMKLRTKSDEVRFVQNADETQFEVKHQKWQDFSDDPTAGNLDDLIMVGHDRRILQPGGRQYDLDGRLLDIRTGRVRRIPSTSGIVLPGCFLKDRRSVVCSGWDIETGAIRPYRIDLKTGDNQPLGGRLLETGITLGYDLSPDGTTIVTAHMRPTVGKSILHRQIYLIDVGTGEARPIGKPMDTAFLNWTADGRHIVLLHRESVDPTLPSVTSLAIMDLEGSVKILRRGDVPTLLADRKTILYEDNDTRRWHTCDLNGKNNKLFGQGLEGFGFPSPSPDGKRLVMTRHAPGKLPELVVIQIGEFKATAIEVEPGLWGLPAWR